MIEQTTAFTLFDKILSGLGLIREGQKARNEKTDHALLALYVALTETKSYIESREKGKRRNRNREFELAQLWHNASIPLRTIDKDFATCEIMGLSSLDGRRNEGKWIRLLYCSNRLRKDLSSHLMHNHMPFAGVYRRFQVCRADKCIGECFFVSIVSQNGLQINFSPG